MAYFNGQNYISEQIDSILAQKNVDVELHIFDDKSNKSSFEFLKNFKSERIFIHDSSENKGPQFRFLDSLRGFEHSEFVSWADQDDIWDPDKLHVAINKIQELDTAALYCSNVEIYKILQPRLISRLPRFTRYGSPHFPLSFFENSAMGCTVVLNRKSVELLTKCFDSKIIMHDWFALLVILACGQVVFDPDSHMKYRIHNVQTVGLKQRRSINSVLGFNHIHLAVDQIKFVWENYESFMDDGNKREFSDFLDCISSPIMSSIRLQYFIFGGKKFRIGVVAHYFFVAKLLLININKRR